MKTTRTAISLLAITAMAALSGCSSASPSPEASDVTLSKDITLVVGTSSSEGAYFTESGLFDDVPYNIEWSYITDWGAIYSSIASDALNVGYWGLDANIFSAVQNGVGAKLVSLLGPAGGDATQTGTLDVFVRTDANIDTTADLEGAKIATGSAGTTFDNVLLGALDDGGLTTDDVDIVRYPDSDQTSQISALLNGDVQAFAGSIESEQIIDALDAGTIKVLYWESDLLPINRIVVSNDQTLDDPEKAAALEDFTQRVARTAYWKQDEANLDAYTKILSETTNLPTATAEKAWEYTRGSTLPLALDDDTSALLSQSIDDFVTLGYLDEPVDVSDVLDTRYADAISDVIANH